MILSLSCCDVSLLLLIKFLTWTHSYQRLNLRVLESEVEMVSSCEMLMADGKSEWW